MARGIVHIILWRICGIVPDAQIHISGGTESEILEKTDFSVYVAECPPSIIFRCSLVQFHDCHRVRHIVLYVRRRMEQRTRILRIIVFSRCIRHIRRHSNTLFISLSNDQGYWKTISGEVFNLRYSKNKKKIYSASDQQTSQPASDDEGLGSDD